jgi:hypothetical protein
MKEFQDLAIWQRHNPGETFLVIHQQPPPLTYGSSATMGDMVDLGTNTAPWTLEAARKLEMIGRLHHNWDSYGGLPLKPEVKKLALRLLGWLGMGDLPVPAVVLGSNGTVQMEWRSNGKELEVELRDDDTIEYLKASPDGTIEEGEAVQDLPRRLRELAHWLSR